MKKYLALTAIFTAVGLTMSCGKQTETAQAPAEEVEKPIQHKQVPDITEADEAKKVFLETTEQITGMQNLDAAELHEIHMITYSLEKAVAYYAENLTGDQQAAAQSIAEVVENIHLNSENMRVEETREHIADFAKQAEAFTAEL